MFFARHSGIPVFFSERGQRWRNILKTTCAMALGAGLSGIYLLPAMLDRWKVQIESWVADLYDYRKYWVFHQLVWPPDLELRILFLNLLTLAFIGVLFLDCSSRGPSNT
jgi:hypothetical protein